MNRRWILNESAMNFCFNLEKVAGCLSVRILQLPLLERRAHNFGRRTELDEAIYRVGSSVVQSVLLRTVILLICGYCRILTGAYSCGNAVYPVGTWSNRTPSARTTRLR